MSRSKTVRAALVVTLTTVISIVGVAQEVPPRSDVVFPRVVKMVNANGRLYSVTSQRGKDLQADTQSPDSSVNYLLLHLPVRAEGSMGRPIVMGDQPLVCLPDYEIVGDIICWSGLARSPKSTASFQRRGLWAAGSPSGLDHRKPVISSLPTLASLSAPAAPWPSSLEPVEMIRWGSHNRESVSYKLAVQDTNLAVWVYQGTLLSEWRYNRRKVSPREKGGQLRTISLDSDGIPDALDLWDKAGSYRMRFEGGFSIIPGSTPLVLTDGGELYRLVDAKAMLVTTILRDGQEELRKGADTARSSPKRQSRLVLLELKDQKKCALFQWDGETPKALDVQDREKQSIEPFLPAKEVDEKIIKAVTAMMLQRDKDEKAVAEFRRKQEKERKKKLAEEAKKPKSMTLQERLQQNERGK